MKYEITGYRKGDEDQIAELFSEAFGGRAFDTRAWQRNNLANSVQSFCVASMWDQNVLIAHTELSMARAMLDGRSAMSGVSGTTMARQGYPGASVAVYRWIDREYAACVKIGFPNEQSFPLIEKVLRHRYVGDIDFWWKQLDVELSPGSQQTTGYRIEEASIPSETLDFSAIYEGCRYSLVRDKDFVQWRFINRTEKAYKYFECNESGRVSGYVVLNRFHDADSDAWHGQIVDIIAQSDHAFDALLQFSEEWFARERIGLIKIWCSLPRFQEVLMRRGYQYGLRPFHVELWHHDMELNEMNLTMADSDVF